MIDRPRCVVDTNVLISAYLSPRGTPRRVVDWLAGNGVFLASAETLYEFSDRFVGRSKFDRYLSLEEREGIAFGVAGRVRLIQVTSEVKEARDPDDDKFIALALDGKADYIITGNTKDFPREFRGVSIVTPVQFAEVYSI